MKTLNKKIIISAFLICLVLQMVFLFGLAAKFLLAQTTPTFTAQFVNVPSMPFSGTTRLYAQTNEIVDSVDFKVMSNTGSNTIYTGQPGSNNQYYFDWKTTDFANDSYIIKAIAYKSGYETAYAHIYGATVYNVATTTPLTIVFSEDYSASTISGEKTIYALPSKDVSTVEFKIISSSGIIDSYTVTKDISSNKYYFVWNTPKFANGTYTLKAIANGIAETAYAQTTVTVYNSAVTPTTPTFTINAGIEGITASGQTINGTKNFWANSASSDLTSALISLDFMLKDTSDNSYVHIATASTADSKNWSGSWNSANISDGNYDFFAEGKYRKTDGTYVGYKSSFLNINIKNTVATPALSISFYEDYSASAISGIKKIYAVPNKDVGFVDFMVIPSSGTSISFSGTKDATVNKYFFTWDTTYGFANGTYTIKATAAAIDKTETNYAQKTVTVYNAAATIPLNVEFVNVPPMPLAGDKKFQIKTNLELTSVKFEVKGAKYMSFPAIKIDANNYYFLWKTAEFPNGDYLVYAFIEKETEKIDRYTKTSVNNSTATATPTTSIIITFIEKFTPPLSGDQKISISTDQEIYDCKFKIEGPKYAEMAGIKDGPSQCHILLRTPDFPNGDYVIRAIAGRDSLVGENKLSTRIENQTGSAQSIPTTTPAPNSIPTSTPVPAIEPVTTNTTYLPQECEDKGFLTIEECHKYLALHYECRKVNILDPAKCKEYLFKQAMPQECLDQNAQTQEECEKIMTLKSMPVECQQQKTDTKKECDKIMKLQFLLTPECKNANIADAEKCKEYMAKNFMPEECRLANITAKEECDYLLRNKYSNLENSVKAKIKTDYYIDPENFPEECKEAGITNLEECKKLMAVNSFPEECKKENVRDEKECKKIMFKKYGPEECIGAQILQPEECEKFMFKKYAPGDCIQAGITNSEACKKYMFEKYGNKENIPQDKFPIECQKANVKTADECERVMKKMYMPKECAENGISGEKECGIYFKQKYMPQECREAEAKSREGCDKIMFKKFGPPECKKAGIEDENECEKFISNKYSDKVRCEGSEQWQCKNTIEERHIGNIAATQSRFEEVKEKTADLIGKTINLEDLKIETADEKEISPLKKSAGLKIVAAEEKIVLDEEENLIQTSPVAFMIDSDEDELPDDIEKRIGTDPFSKDTDGDGYSDGEEIKSGYNPLGEGKFEKEISPVDEAILQNKIIEHPKTEGEETENLAVENINNIKNEQDETSVGYLLNGKSEPDSVATIYIYSDLPLVVTVKTDDYGNWKYELDKPLVEGEHEVYVVINDNTGKISGKSKPFNFFVKEAKAISIKDFITSEAKAAAAQDGVSESENNYVFTILLLIAGGIFAFLIIIAKKRKQVVK